MAQIAAEAEKLVKPASNETAETPRTPQQPAAPVRVSRLDLPFLMITGELLQRQSPAVQLRSTADGKGYDRIAGTLYLTNARLWFEPAQITGDAMRQALEQKGALKATSIPLLFVVKATLRNVKRKPVLRLEYDNSGREYFAVPDVTIWRDGILAAAPNAPDLPFNREPTYQHGLDYKGHMIMAALRALLTVLVIAAVLAYFEPVWRPYLPKVAALIRSLLRR
jgi:hypothetical protein